MVDTGDLPTGAGEPGVPPWRRHLQRHLRGNRQTYSGIAHPETASNLNMLDDESRDDAVAAPELTEKEQQEAEDRTTVRAHVVHEAIRYDGEEELNRPIGALFWSGLAAGMSMGFSFVAMALFRSYLPDAKWTPLVVRLGYPVGFLIVILGRQQLFTENTLTAIIPLLARRTGRRSRVWRGCGPSFFWRTWSALICSPGSSAIRRCSAPKFGTRCWNSRRKLPT